MNRYAGWVCGICALMPGLAATMPMTFEYQGYCDDSLVLTSCGAIGLNHLDPVSGFVSTVDGLDADDDDPNILWASEITDFGFSFGDLLIQPTTYAASGFLTLDEAGTDFGGGLLNNMRFSSLSTSFGVSISAANTGSIFGFSGWTARDGLNIASGPGSYTSVPEPATFPLLLTGLIGLGLMARRRERARQIRRQPA